MLEFLTDLEKTIFVINEDNIETIVQSIIKMSSKKYPFSFYLTVLHIVYIFYTKRNPSDELLFHFLEELDKNQTEIKIFKMFSKQLLFVYDINNESDHLIQKFIEQNIIDPKDINHRYSLYFAHITASKKITKQTLPVNIYAKEYDSYFVESIKELSQNNWELHKHLIKEGHNPNELSKIIRNDDIEKLQEISSQPNFDFNQTFKPSIYERCSFINQWNVTLIDYAAFFGSVKCFKYLLLNVANIINTGKYAVAGGNEEIIHLCVQNHSSFVGGYESAIMFHRNDIFQYLFDNKIEEIVNYSTLGDICISHDNYEIFKFLTENNMVIKDFMLDTAAKTGNTFITTYMLKFKTPSEKVLIYAAVSRNYELFKLLLKQKDI